MLMTDDSRKFKVSKGYLITAALFAVALFVLVPQLNQFSDSWHFLKSPDPIWALAAIALTLLSYFAAAATYCFLAFNKLPYAQTVLVQFAVMFINRILPSGVGALGANFAYLRRQKHNSGQAASIVAVNNFLGFAGHSILFVLALAVLQGGNNQLMHPDLPGGQSLLVVGAVLVMGMILLFILARSKLAKFMSDIKQQLLSYREQPQRLVLALLSSMALTAANAACLYASAAALGVHPSAAVTLIVLSLGVGAGIALPTPGGIGGFEAGLTAALVAYDVNASLALAIALLYRLISYWLMLAVGAVALVLCQRKRLFAFAT